MEREGIQGKDMTEMRIIPIRVAICYFCQNFRGNISYSGMMDIFIKNDFIDVSLDI